LKHIRLRINIFAIIFALGIAVCVFLIFFSAVSSGTSGYLMSAVMFLASTVSAIYCIREYKKLKMARLITENPILHIRTAVIRDISNEMEQTKADNADVFASYFGILLGAEIIKFNQDGIRLHTVEFGSDYISLTYGTEKRMQRTRLLRPVLSREELDRVVEKFRYETGIVPDICC
jgi:hypothetical protein